jgi:hypothetical protein
LDAGFKAICTHRRKARRRERTCITAQRPEDAMQKVKRDQLWDVLRSGEWCRARVVNVLSDRVNLFITGHDAVKANAVMVTLGEMKNSEKFRFVAEGGELPE